MRPRGHSSYCRSSGPTDARGVPAGMTARAARPGVARRMTAWCGWPVVPVGMTARAARPVGGPARSLPARPDHGGAGPRVPCPCVLTTAGRARRMARVLPCPQPSNHAVQRTPLARFLELSLSTIWRMCWTCMRSQKIPDARRTVSMRAPSNYKFIPICFSAASGSHKSAIAYNSLMLSFKPS